MKQYAYTGDVKRLKTIDYTFQKLYAMNYKSYHKDEIFMFVVSKMVLEISNLSSEHQAKFIAFILNNKDKSKDFWLRSNPNKTSSDPVVNAMFTDMPEIYLTRNGRIVNAPLWKDIRNEYWLAMDGVNKREEAGDITKEEADLLKDELYDTLEGARDPYLFRWDRVQAIIALDALHPLELIDV